VGKRQRGGGLRSGERDLAGGAHRRAERAAHRGRVYRRRDEEAAAPGVRVADQPEAGGRMLRPLHDHVLEEIAEARLDGALVARLDLEVVRNRPLLIHGAVGLDEDGARGVAVAGARRVELLERGEARLDTGELVLARAHRARAPLVLDPRAGALRFAPRARDLRRLDRLVRAPQEVGSGGAVGGSAIRLDPDVVQLDVELRERLASAIARGGSVLERVAQRGRRIHDREDFAARGCDVGLEPLDLAVRRVVRLGLEGERGGSAIALEVRLGCGVAPRPERQSSGFAPRLEAAELRGDGRRARVERIDLLPIERYLLLLA